MLNPDKMVMENHGASTSDEQRPCAPAPVESLPWRCFHCDFTTFDLEEASAHFGDRDDGEPICRTWADLNADERLAEYQSLVRELNAERDYSQRLRSENESLDYRVVCQETEIRSRFRKWGSRSVNDAANVLDTLEGRILCGELYRRALLAISQCTLTGVDFGDYVQATCEDALQGNEPECWNCGTAAHEGPCVQEAEDTPVAAIEVGCVSSDVEPPDVAGGIR